MTFNNPKDLFVKILSDVRESEYSLTTAFKELRETAQDQRAKDILDSLVFLQDKNVATLDQCFKLIGAQPVKTDDKFINMFLENFRKEFTEIQSPVAKTVFLFSKINHLINFRISEYMTLIAMSKKSDYKGVGLLLNNVLAPRIEFLEYSRHKITDYVEKE
jgi:ferritin-like metal-binding protein YciE